MSENPKLIKRVCVRVTSHFHHVVSFIKLQTVTDLFSAFNGTKVEIKTDRTHHVQAGGGGFGEGGGEGGSR